MNGKIEDHLSSMEKENKVWLEKFANVLAHVWVKWNKQTIMELNRMELSNEDTELHADAAELHVLES